MTLTPGTRLGAYQILDRLGEGGMGEVFRATDTNLKRQVAIKVLPEALASDDDRLARFQREAEVLASLNHPNIAAIYGLERGHRGPGQPAFIVMELVEGPTLADRIAQGPLPIDELLPIARQIADALEAAHEQGVVHRDLKPANIKLRPDGAVKLLDFGLAKALAGASGAGTTAGAMSFAATIESPIVPSAHTGDRRVTTEAGMILGTAAYMSPEQARGRPADRRADIWAFGVVVAEMATGRRPFDGETISDTIAAVLTREPDLAAVPPSLRRMVRQCLAKDPRERLRHIGDAFALVDDSSGAVAAPSRRPRWALAYPITIAVLAAALAGAAWMALRPRDVDRPVNRFYVDAPPGGTFNYTYTATGVSPDGRQLVFRVATANDAPALWLRPIDALAARRLAGTEGADFPFWSPDGRSVAFFSAGKLKRVDIAGGSPIVLCDASDADVIVTGGSWSRDGVIVFGAPEGLYRVSASGGTPTLVAAVNRAARETGYGNPQFLPDGDRLLMFVRSEDRTIAGHYVSSLSHPERRTLLLNGWGRAVFVANEGGASSYLLYLQDRTLLARRFDGRTLTLSGDPVSMATDIALFPPGYHASFWSSAAGNLLAYRTEASDKPRLTWVYSDRKRETATGTEDFFTHVRLAPDGSRAAMELADATGNVDIWTWDFARRSKTRQTFDGKADRAPTWAPNGRELAFSSNRTGNWQLFRKDVNSGAPEEQLTTGSDDKIVPDWSRDGRFLIHIQIGATTAEDIWALPLEGDRKPFPVVQSTANETNPALSPDGRWLAFESSQTGRSEIFVTPFDGSRRTLDASAPRWQVSTTGGSRPRWSGDGRALYFVSLDDLGLMRADVRSTAAGFESSVPAVFTEIPVMPVARAPFDTTIDGRILLLERTITRGVPLAVITNWAAALP
jgi:eukaryotic-like serine/threonine-protein kinase